MRSNQSEQLQNVSLGLRVVGYYKTLCYGALVHLHVMLDACDVRERSEKVSDLSKFDQVSGRIEMVLEEKKNFLKQSTFF